MLDAWMIQTLSNVGFVLAVVFILNGITKGFVFMYARIWASRGKLILIEISHPIQNYCAVGWVEDDFIIYKDRTVKGNKKENFKKVPYVSGCVIRWMGINRITIDETVHCIIVPDLRKIVPVDVKKYNNWFLRALSEPRNKSDINKMNILFLLMGVVILGIVLVVYNIFTLHSALDLLKASVDKIKPTVGTINCLIGTWMFKGWKK